MSRTASPSSASACAARTFPTWEARLTAIKNGSFFSSASSQASTAPEIACAPCVRDRPRRSLAAGSCELLDLSPADRIAVSPRGDLRHFGSERHRILADDLDERPRRLGVRVNRRLLELRARPGDELRALRDVVPEDLALCRGELLERRVLLGVVCHEHEHRVGCRIVEVRLQRVDVLLCANSSTDSTTTARPPESPKRPSALAEATVSAPDEECAESCSTESGPNRSRRRLRATVRFGRSLPVSR